MTHRSDPPASTAKAAVRRQQAEAEVVRHSYPARPTTPEQVDRLLHELRVHQVQLEMQNEELRTVQVELADQREQYFDLYDLAPVGYCTVSAKGLIVQANLTLSSLLGVTRGALLQAPLSEFILPEDQDVDYLYRRTLPRAQASSASPIATGKVCELRMTRRNGAPFWAQLTARRMPGDDRDCAWRIIIHEITERKQAEAAL